MLSLLLLIGIHIGRMEMLLCNNQSALELISIFVEKLSNSELSVQTWFESLEMLSQIRELVAQEMTEEISTELRGINAFIKQALSLEANNAYDEKNYYALSQKNAWGYRLIDFLSVGWLDFSTRTYNLLTRNDILYVSDIIKIPRQNFDEVLAERSHYSNVHRFSEEIFDRMDALNDEVFGVLWPIS